MVGARACVCDFADARGEILADAGNFAKLVWREGGKLVRMVAGNIGAVSVRADLERVLVLDLEEVSDLPEHARDPFVIQTAGLLFRNENRADARLRLQAPARSRRAPSAGRSRRGIRPRPLRTLWRPVRRRGLP